MSGAASEPGLRPRLITLTVTFIIPDITKTESYNNQNEEISKFGAVNKL